MDGAETLFAPFCFETHQFANTGSGQRLENLKKGHVSPGNFTDPKHPLGYRMLSLSEDGTSAVIFGNDNEKVGVAWTLHARITGVACLHSTILARCS
jgi:hypothetical protein